jgi:hypothetical protein
MEGMKRRRVVAQLPKRWRLEHVGQERTFPEGLFLVARSRSNPLSVLVRHCRSRFSPGVKPVKDQRLDHTLGVCQMRGAVIFKGFKEFPVETISPLHGLRMWFQFRSATI